MALVGDFSAELPFVAVPVGSAAAAAEVAAEAAHCWDLPSPALLRVGMNALFTCGDEVVLRVGRVSGPPEAGPWLAEHLLRHGLRVPQPLPIPPWSRAGLTVFAQRRERSVGPVDWEEVGDMVARLHQLDPAPIAAHHPVPRAATFPWWDFVRLLAEVDDLLDEVARDALVAAVRRHGEWHRRTVPEVLCHGDVHPGNVLQSVDGAVLLDWDLVCRAPAAWDHAPLLTWSERWGGEPGVYSRFAAGYGRSFASDELGLGLAELRLVAATLMRLKAGRTDGGAADEARRRLRWWRGERDAPAWTAQ